MRLHVPSTLNRAGGPQRCSGFGDFGFFARWPGVRGETVVTLDVWVREMKLSSLLNVWVREMRAGGRGKGVGGGGGGGVMTGCPKLIGLRVQSACELKLCAAPVQLI